MQLSQSLWGMEGLNLPGAVERLADVVDPEDLAVGGIKEWHPEPVTEGRTALRHSLRVAFSLGQHSLGPRVTFLASTTPSTCPSSHSA
jgi:hypothetical protein